MALTKIAFMLVFAFLAIVCGFVFVAGIKRHNSGLDKVQFAATDKRLIQTYAGESSIEYIIIEYQNLRDIKLKDGNDGIGTIVCYSDAPFVVDHLRFTHIENVDAVYQLIVSLKEQHGKNAR